MPVDWIWENEAPKADEYAEFDSEFTPEGTEVSVTVSCDSNYALYLNGELASFGQFADYPHCKVYDSLTVRGAKAGERNVLTFVVWYYGSGSSCYIPGKAGLCFTVREGEKLLDLSGKHTQCRKAKGYVPYRCKNITGQLGFTFAYDETRPAGESHGSFVTGYAPQPHERPNDKLVLDTPVQGKTILAEGGTHFLFDLGREEVGFLSIEADSGTEQELLIAYGEHLRGGKVARIIAGRDFSVTYKTKIGSNAYMNPFRRLGARYIEVTAEQPLNSLSIALVPTLYPLTELPFDAGNARRQKIYDVCVRTLRLCMHEHYEDCPWREQALYCMDSRNQMLAGYAAFGETRFPRSSLWLMAQDRRKDGLLSITFPHGGDLAIPSFSLHWFTEVEEYVRYSGDTDFAREIWEKLNSVLAVFTERLREGLCPAFGGTNHWNFYEWSDGLSGSLSKAQKEEPDLLINCLLIRAIEEMNVLSAKTGLPVTAGADTDAIRDAIRWTFRTADGLYEDFAGSAHKSELGLALAVLAGVPSAEEAAAICGVLTRADNGLVPVTLSMKCFVYDALLQTDTGKYAPWVLADIDRVWGRMIDAGATSVWETEKGAADFGGAGSLCHGWSATPVYYYKELLR